jgi:hypothetical protein
MERAAHQSTRSNRNPGAQRVLQALRDIFSLNSREQAVLAVVGALILLGLLIRVALVLTA